MAFCYFDGEIVEEAKVSISIHNLGIQRGFGIFDLFRARNGKPTFMEDHLDRFDQSQHFLGLNQLISKEEIRKAVDDLQQKNNFKESTFRLMLLGDGSETDPILGPLFYIINKDISHYKNPESASVITHEYLREYPGIKSINYFTSNFLHRKKMEASAIDVIYHHGDKISEASRSNVFVVKDRVLLTPKDDILLGITRKRVLQLTESLMPVEVTDVSLDDFLSADEVFISSTLKEILPIVKADEKSIGEGQIGPFTKKIQTLFLDQFYQ